MTTPRPAAEQSPTQPSSGSECPVAPVVAEQVFNAALPQAQEYAELLARDGVPRGLIGPREVPRLWDRHLLNSAMLTDLIPVGQRVVDVGAGAGLPGIPMAVRRPDLRVDLVEPMLRRTKFLTEATAALGLNDRVRVIRGRAEDRSVIDAVGGAAYVVARAVAPLDRLARWCLPLLGPKGTLLALKGASAAAELDAHRGVLRSLGATDAAVQLLDTVDGVEPTSVIRIRVDQRAGGRRRE